jgi:hypothetical protein
MVSRRSVLALALLLLLLAPEHMLPVAPWLAQQVAEASSRAGWCPTCKVDLAALQDNEAYGFHVLFKQCYSRGHPGIIGPISFSGSSAYISGNGRYVYIGAGDGVHIVDLATGKEVAKASMPSAVFCGNSPTALFLSSLTPDHLVEGPNGTVVAAPHFSNPHVIYPNGSKREIPVYDKSELASLYSYQLKGEGADYFWGNSKGIAAFNYNGQVYWKKDYSLEGGIHQVSVKNTVAALSKEGTLHLLDRTTGSEIKAVKGVRAVAEAGGSHYVALDGGNKTPIALLYDDGTMTDPFYTIDDVVVKMASGVSRGITALFALSPSTLYILFIVNQMEVIGTDQYPVRARYIKVREEGETLLAVATGAETLVLRVDGIQVTVLVYKKNEQPANSADVAFAKTQDVKDMDGKNVVVTQPYNGSVLLVEVFEAGVCAQISLLNPKQLKPGPHVEVRGAASAQGRLGGGSSMSISFSQGSHFTPLRVVVELGRVEVQKQTAPLVARDSGGLPSVTPAYLDSEAGPFAVFGRTQTFWNVSLRPDGGLRADYRFRGVVHANPIAWSKSVPVASLAVFWYRLLPTRIDTVDRIAVTASIVSTGVNKQAPAWVALAGEVQVGALMYIHLKAFHASAKTFAEAWKEFQLYGPYTSAGRSNPSLLQTLTQRIRELLSERVGDSARAKVTGELRLTGADKLYAEAARQGVEADKLSNSLRVAVQNALEARVAAARQAISPYEEVRAVVSAYDHALAGLQQEAYTAGRAVVNLGDISVELQPDDLQGLMKLFREGVLERASELGKKWYSAYGVEKFHGSTVSEAADYVFNNMRNILVREGYSPAQAAQIARDAVFALLESSMEEAALAVAFKGVDGAAAVGAFFAAIPTFGLLGLHLKRVEGALPPTPEEVAASLRNELVSQGVPPSKADAIAGTLPRVGSLIWNVEGSREVEYGLSVNVGSAAAVAGSAIGVYVLRAIAGGATASTVTVSSLAAAAAAVAISAYYLTQAVIAQFTILDIGEGKVGSTVLRGVAFRVALPQGGEAVLLAVERLPDVKLSTLNAQSLRDNLYRALESAATSLGARRVVVREFEFADAESIDWRAELLRAFGSGAVLLEAGPAVIPVFWALPQPLTDVSAEWTGYVDVREFRVDAVFETRRVLEGGQAQLPPEVWKQLKVTAYGAYGKPLGDFVPYAVEEGGRRAVFLAPMCLYDVARIEVAPGSAWAAYGVDATVTVEGAIIADAALQDERHGLWRADAEWRSEAEFRTAAVGIYGFRQIYRVSSQTSGGRQAFLNYSDVLRYWDDGTKTFFMPGSYLTGPVGREWAATFWVATKPYEIPQPQPNPAPIPTPVQPVPEPRPAPLPDGYSENVEPRPRTPTIPPEYAVRPGEVWIGLYVNGTKPFGTLPTLLTVYLYTVDRARVYFSVNYSISVEEGAAWRAAESGPVMSGTVDMPGNYSVVYNARIAHLVDKAALLANQTGAPVIVGFHGWARRLDTNKTSSAYLGVPVLPGHVPVKPAASVTFYVYDAVARNGIPGANVTVLGPDRLTGLTNSTGYLTFADVRSGTYAVTVSAAGYQPFSTVVTVARDMLLNVPLLPVNAASASALLVKVSTSDGVPVEGAAVYVNGTLAGYTDSYGEWGASYPWGSRLNVTASYRGWMASQLVEMVYPRVLAVFEYPGRSEIFRPQVSAIYVQPISPRVGAYRNMTLLCAVMVNSNNTYTAEVGFKKDGRVVSRTVVTRSPGRSMLDIFVVTVNATEAGRLVPYLNVTWARADSDPRDNYVEGEPVRAVATVYVSIGISYDVERWAFGVPGLIYPGETMFRVNVTVWVTRARGGVPLRAPLRLAARLDHILLTAYSQPLGVANATSLANATLLSVLVPCPHARYMVLRLEPLSPLNATDDYEVVYTLPAPREVELPPHVIVGEAAEPLTPTVRPGGTVKVRVRVWTNLVKPGEGVGAKLYFHVGVMQNGSMRFSSWSQPFNLTPGDQVVEVEVPMPRDYQLTVFDVYRQEKGVFFLGAVKDSWVDDNWAYATLNIVNTGSALFWLLVVAGVMLLIAVILALRRPVVVARSTAELLQSEWVE